MILTAFIFGSCSNPDPELNRLKEAQQKTLTLYNGAKTEFINALVELNQMKSWEDKAKDHLDRMKRIQSALETTLKNHIDDDKSGDYTLLSHKKMTADNDVAQAEADFNEIRLGINSQNTLVNEKKNDINLHLKNFTDAENALNSYLNKR